MSRAVLRSPELKAGWPQQVCGGTSTVQPASSNSLTAAKPTDGGTRSTRQVTNRPTRFGCCCDAVRSAIRFSSQPSCRYGDDESEPIIDKRDRGRKAPRHLFSQQQGL